MRILVDYRPALRSRTGVGEYVHQRMPLSQLVYMKATGHCPNLSAPGETIEAIAGFLQSEARTCTATVCGYGAGAGASVTATVDDVTGLARSVPQALEGAEGHRQHLLEQGQRLLVVQARRRLVAPKDR